jgi:23S rRNA (guanosine2251-2'-O)-methyltransferase
MTTKKQHTEVIFGIHPIAELLRAKKRKIITLYTTNPTPKQWHYIQSLLPQYPIDIKQVSKESLTQYAGSSDHQGVVAYAQPFVLHSKLFDTKKHTSLIVLDGIQDPRNLGAIIRSAYCTDTAGVLITEKNSAPLNAVALKAAAGLAEHMLIRYVPSAEVAAMELKEAGYGIYCGTFRGKDIRAIQFQIPYALIVGSEGSGISPALQKNATLVTLPQKTPHISYNASVAAGILLFTAASQQKAI